MKIEPNDQGQTMQRVKVGMTGLAIVLLLIGLASAIFTSASRDRPATIAGGHGDPLANVEVANASGANEPLAELGVAPSTQGDSAATNTAMPTSGRVR